MRHLGALAHALLLEVLRVGRRVLDLRRLELVLAVFDGLGDFVGLALAGLIEAFVVGVLLLDDRLTVATFSFLSVTSLLLHVTALGRELVLLLLLGKLGSGVLLLLASALVALCTHIWYRLRHQCLSNRLCYLDALRDVVVLQMRLRACGVALCGHIGRLC